MTKKREGAKMGRPPLKPEDRRSVKISIRITPGEVARLDAEARRLGLPVGEVLMLPWRKGKTK